MNSSCKLKISWICLFSSRQLEKFWERSVDIRFCLLKAKKSLLFLLLSISWICYTCLLAWRMHHVNNQELELKCFSALLKEPRERSPSTHIYHKKDDTLLNSYTCTNTRQNSGGVLGEKFVFCCATWQQAPSGDTNTAICESFFSSG